MVFSGQLQSALEGGKCPNSLRRVRLGVRFRQCLYGTKWPAGLELLDVAGCDLSWAKVPVQGWPPGLQKVS